MITCSSKEINSYFEDYSIEKLHLRFKGLTKIPKSIGNIYNLIELDLSNNYLSILPESIGNLRNLKILYLENNNLTMLPVSICNLTNLKYLYLSNNNLTTLPKNIGNLYNLIVFYLCNNYLSILPESIGNLKNLETLYLPDNRLVTLSTSICNLTRLINIQYYGNPIEHIPIIGRRLIDRLENKNQNTQHIYNDRQSIHNYDIQESFRKSLYSLLNDKLVIDKDKLIKDVIHDTILDCKEQLLEYINNTDIHSILQVSFLDVFLLVWQRIQKHKENIEIKKILNIEMKDTLCMCYTGTLTRLFNCLNGYYDDIVIQISNNEQISNIISTIMKKETNIKKIKKKFIKEMKERDYRDTTINMWLSYIE
jgi:hypothetical protein